MIAFGIIAMIQPIDSLGIDVTNGIAYLLTGAFLLIAAIASPPAIVADRSVVEDRSFTL